MAVDNLLVQRMSAIERVIYERDVIDLLCAMRGKRSCAKMQLLCEGCRSAQVVVIVMEEKVRKRWNHGDFMGSSLPGRSLARQNSTCTE